MSGQIRVIKINPGSDGDPSHKPSRSDHRQVSPPTQYLEKLGSLWTAHRGDGQNGVSYVLDKLPAGYTVWERPRPGNPSHIDKWCYGHPKGGKPFDSVNRFFPHFLNLMERGSSDGCKCVSCAKPGSTTKRNIRSVGHSAGKVSAAKSSTGKSSAGQSSAGPRAGPKGRRWVEGRTDDEGTPDVYRNSIDKLKRATTVDILIKEDMSFDWRVERENIAEHLEITANQSLWAPRLAEIVLFVRKLHESEEIKCDDSDGQFKIWSKTQRRFITYPRWEAGLVTQTAEEDCSIQELVTQTTKMNAVNYSGFRVEPLPDPNSEQKNYSKQYTYVYLNQTRPFIFWKEFLAGTPRQKWSPTILHALTITSTVALVEKYRFKGTWPTAKVYCRGVYIGPELITEGDIVRLLPTDHDSEEITDVLKIESITLDFTKLDEANEDDYDEGHPFNSTIHMTGTIFTLSKGRAFSQQRLMKEIPANFAPYGYWYLRTDPSKRARIPFHRIMGRCYDAIAMELWHPNQTSSESSPITSLSTGLVGLREARKFSSTQNHRIMGDRSWFWGESRVEALDVHEINGVDVSSQDDDRAESCKEWRKHIRILDGTAGVAERQEMLEASNRVLVRSSIGRKNSMITGALGLGEDASSAETEGSRDISRKRSRGAIESGEGDGGGDSMDDFVDQASTGIGMPMNDEFLEDDVDGIEVSSGKEAPRGRRMEIVID